MSPGGGRNKNCCRPVTGSASIVEGSICMTHLVAEGYGPAPRSFERT